MAVPLIACVVGILVVLAAVLLANASRVKPTTVEDPLPPSSEKGSEASVERFQELLRSATVWGAENPHADHTPFDEFIAKLKRLFPLVFAQLELTMVNTYGIMLRWAGSNPGLPPIVLMAHYDVVEADPAGWTCDPFGADIVDGRIYARGTVDTKCIVAALFEAAEALLAEGFTPPRDIYICSSNCEEDTGETTPRMIELFTEKGITPAFVLDEGGAVIDKAPLGIDQEFAFVGVAEKGFLNARITVASPGGHASTPAATDAPAKLVFGLGSLLANPAPARLSPAVAAMLKELAAYGGFGLKLVFGNLWLFKPLVLKILKGNGETAAMVRTTYALTELKGSKAANVIPRRAKATVNVRIDPAEDIKTAFSRIKGCFDEGTEILLGNEIEPSPISPFDDEAFSYLRKVIHAVYPDAGIAPYVQSSRSDACYFARICPHTYRFAGFLLKGDQRSRIHGQDENLDVESYRRGIGFYIELIRNIAQLRARD
ncbi:MAG: M20/M25/M40 family metallo-hydrolase [Coriobacteriaceae bacterium]|jgi:carboxypeptidase PM20D1|nr:M20/M25/M40 family metallo-hydrolase [Coriobacteriaceae bacterium]